ncbi:glycosyltransferase [Bradyrhizobium sp. 15]|uniref:glycosyltransferase n=1 Tax=Bradyrhizobium sp. 15 TaxID=2782633 RepID=UPI001FFB30DB|nr:glycosyltransferase [Bradyrhizobium sp. 15]MCK1434944.1 glycosyltransferase family 4 protein [Bradyrhizobium sp. 15]
MKLSIWHNIMWSRYKAAVFSALQTLCEERAVKLQVYQIAETASQRAGLSPTDTSWHRYPYNLLFQGSYEAIPKLSLFWSVAKRSWVDDSDVVILAGYDKLEYWIQAAILLARGKTFACFCDSTMHDRQQRFLPGLFKRIFFGWCAGIFCYGVRAAEYVKLYGATSKKIIHRCQAAALYAEYTEELAHNRRLHEFDESGPARYLYVGRLSPEKSIDHLILAFDRVKKAKSDAKLVLVGSGSEEHQLRHLCRRLGLEDAIEFAGPKSGESLFAEYLKATALVLPSYSEPWGLVVNEALSHGCPVVVSDRCGCVPELVSDGQTGYSFRWGDLDDLSEKLQAVARLQHTALVSQVCLNQIAPYTPESAARSILDGSIGLHQLRSNSR